jgi:PAS domain S-box-containing protein
MNDVRPERDPLLEELRSLRQRLADLEAVEIERNEVNAALRASEERFRFLYDNVPAMYFTLDADGNIVSVNTHGATELGYTPDELIGSSVLRVFHEEDRQAVLEQFQQVVPNPGKVARWEFRKVRKNGSVLWVQEAVRAVQNAEGQTVVLVVCEDVTWRREAQQKLLDQQAELEALTSQLLLAEERERRRIADGLHDHIGQVLAMAKMKLGEAAQSVEASDTAKTLHEAREMLGQGIAAVRSFSFELSSPVLHELGLEAALQSLCESLSARTEVRFRFQAISPPGPIDEDTAILLFRAVRELTLNIVKHAEAKNAEVRFDHHDGHLRVMVRDDGAGFDADLAGLPPRPEKGFGLFSIRKNLDLLSGSLSVESSPGRGTSVTVTVPRSPAG